MIEVENLVKRYEKADVCAVDGVSFRVEEGMFFALLGPNGAGKTTILSILTTQLSKTSGTVRIGGTDIDRGEAKIRKKIGVVFQRPSLDNDLSAEENIRFHTFLYGLYPFRLTYGMMPGAYKKRVGELADLLGFENDLFRPVKTFSGGMRRKLEVARALIHRPRLLFLDEPTTGLDPISRLNLWKYLTETRRREGTTIFLTTHYLQEADDADLVAIIDQGKLVSLGSPKKIKRDLRAPSLEEAYINLISGA